MVFFDNEWGEFIRLPNTNLNFFLNDFFIKSNAYLMYHIGNCQTVAKIGVTVVYTPKGVTKALFDEALSKYPAPGQIIGKRR